MNAENAVYFGFEGKRNPLYRRLARAGVYNTEYVLDLIEEQKLLKNNKFTLDKHTIKVNSSRYPVFKESLVCSSCGLTGVYFALEKHPGVVGLWHFNLYAINKDNMQVLMTKHHVIPRSKGGTGKLENLQTMCFPCNDLIFKYRSDLNECEMPRPVGRNRPD